MIPIPFTLQQQPTIELVAAQFTNGNNVGNVFSFAPGDWGAEAPDRYILAAAATYGTTTQQINKIQINGVQPSGADFSATGSGSSPTVNVGLAKLLQPTDGDREIRVEGTNVLQSVLVWVFRLSGLLTPTHVEQFNNGNMPYGGFTLPVKQNGGVVSVVAQQGAGRDFTWGGIPQVGSEQSGTNITGGVALNPHMNANAALNVTVSSGVVARGGQLIWAFEF